MWINLTEDQMRLVIDALQHSEEPDTTEQEKLAGHLEETIDNRKSPTNDKWVSAAEERYLSCGPTDGDIDIDSDAVVSDSDEGAYVMMWGWVSNSEAGIEDDEEDEE